MGTKRQLATVVGRLVSECQPGPFVDVFAGMCAVAHSVAPAREIWTNDLQHFAQTVSSAHFCSQSPPPLRQDVVTLVDAVYKRHTHAHFRIASERLRAEEEALKAESPQRLNELYSEWLAEPPLDKREDITYRDATLFRDTFAGSYFGLSQSIEIDGIRTSIDRALLSRRLNVEEHQWLLLALCVALSKCTNSTGHFAQALTAKQASIRRFTMQRKRSIRQSWLEAIEELMPIGNKDWRSRNRSNRGEAVEYLSKLGKGKRGAPAVIYADPPYTSDQYSRYYHVYETALLYDYPSAEGRGRYRSDRSVSNFSLKTQVLDSLNALISTSAELGADLILSYPKNGLLVDSRSIIPELIQGAYGAAPSIIEIEHSHSTMGASKGAGKHEVIEVIYRARH